MPKQGASSGFKYGRVTGALEAVLTISAIAITMVEPSKWKKHFHLQGADKEGARGLAIRQFPAEHRFFARKKDHGRAEATLIALYGVQTSLQLSTPIAITPPAGSSGRSTGSTRHNQGRAADLQLQRRWAISSCERRS
jgi:hypothetical protein